MRAVEPYLSGRIDRDGVGIAYEVFGGGEQTVLFTPIDPIVESRAWKAQVPWLSRRGSSFIWGVWHDARHLADHIATRRSYLAYRPAAVETR